MTKQFCLAGGRSLSRRAPSPLCGNRRSPLGRRIALCAGFIALGVLLSGCPNPTGGGGGASDGGGGSVVSVEAISILSPPSSLEAGETYQLEAMVTPENATNKGVVWTSDAEAVASVDLNGVITAHAVGTATITVTTDDGAHTDAATLSVVPTPVTFIVTTDQATGSGSLTEALSNAKSGDTIVFDASYTITAPGTLADPPNWFSITESVTIDAGSNTVILDANEAGRHFLIENAATLTLRADDGSGGSLELRNGRGENAGTSVVGGSIRVDADAELVTEYVSFTDNRTMPGAASGSGGGAISINGGASITGGTFTRNMTATWGGAIVIQGSATGTLEIRDAVFEENTAGDLGTGNYDGGAIHIGGGAVATIRNSRFEGNSVTSGGGGAIGSYGELIVSGSTFLRNNTSGRGGAIEAGMQGSRARITGSRFYGNSANNGGAIASTHSGFPAPYGQVIVSSSVFVGNLGLDNATFNAEVMRSEGNDVIVTSTIVGNARDTNYVAFQKVGASNPVQVRSSILRASTVGSFVNLHDTLQDVPDFVRTPSPGTDGVWGTEDDDYGDLQLLSTSDAIDSGNNDHLRWDFADLNENGDTTEDEPYDIAGNPRVVNGTVDQGAYEF